MKGLNIVKSIDFAIECSAMTHLNQKVVAKLWLKKGTKWNIILWQIDKRSTTRQCTELLACLLAQVFNVISKLDISSKIMPISFSFFEFVMVNSSNLIFEFSVPLIIKWNLPKLSFSLFSLSQLKTGIHSYSSDLVTKSVFWLIV